MMKSSQIGARKQAAVSCAELCIIFCNFAAAISSCLTLHPTASECWVSETHGRWRQQIHTDVCRKQTGKKSLKIRCPLTGRGSWMLLVKCGTWKEASTAGEDIGLHVPSLLCGGCVAGSVVVSTSANVLTLSGGDAGCCRGRGRPPLSPQAVTAQPSAGLGGARGDISPWAASGEVRWLGCEPGTSCWLAPVSGSVCRFVRPYTESWKVSRGWKSRRNIGVIEGTRGSP